MPTLSFCLKSCSDAPQDTQTNTHTEREARVTCWGGIVDSYFGRVGAQVRVVQRPRSHGSVGRGVVLRPQRPPGPSSRGHVTRVIHDGRGVGPIPRHGCSLLANGEPRQHHFKAGGAGGVHGEGPLRVGGVVFAAPAHGGAVGGGIGGTHTAGFATLTRGVGCGPGAAGVLHFTVHVERRARGAEA